MFPMFQHFAAGLLLLSLAASSWADLDTIIIDQGVDDPIRIAVVPFALSEDLDNADNLAKLIRFDLARSGQFDPVASENMLSYPSTQDAVFFRDWRILETDYLVIGKAQTNVLDQIQVSYQLFDVATQSQLQSVSFNIAREQWRDLGHKIADLVYTEVTGVREAFSTKILYVLAQDIGTQNARYTHRSPTWTASAPAPSLILASRYCPPAGLPTVDVLPMFHLKQGVRALFCRTSMARIGSN